MARGDSGDFIVFHYKLKQVRTLHVSLSQSMRPSLHSISLRTPVPQWLYPVSPRQLLQSDTGVPHFALDPLTYRCLLSLSPAADFAEPRPPSPHTPTARLSPGSPPACSPPTPPISGEEVGYSHLRPRPVDHLEFEGL